MYLTDPKAKVRVGGGESAPWLLRHHKIDLFISLSLKRRRVLSTLVTFLRAPFATTNNHALLQKLARSPTANIQPFFVLTPSARKMQTRN